MIYGQVRVRVPPNIRHLECVIPNPKILGGTIAAEEGTILYRVLADFLPYVNVETEVRSAVTFSEPQVVQGKAVQPLIRQLTGVVDGVVEAFTVAGFVT
jgi:hypothetical protein